MPYSGISEHQTLKRFCSRQTPALCHTLFYRKRASPLRSEAFNVDPVKHLSRFLPTPDQSKAYTELGSQHYFENKLSLHSVEHTATDAPASA